MKLITLIHTGKKWVFRNIFRNIDIIRLPTRVGFGNRFFRDPEPRSRGFGIGIFNFGLDRKIPKIPKLQGKTFGCERFSGHRDFSWFLANSRDSGFFSLVIFTLRIRDFLNIGTLIPGIRDFLNFWIFIPEIFAKSPGFVFSGFFVVWVSRQKAPSDYKFF